MESLFPMVVDLMLELFLLIATIGIGFAINFFRKKTTAEQRKIIDGVVKDGILFAQQVYQHLEGTEKYNKAVEQIVLVLKQKNLKITEEELKLKIEATLKKLKADFQEQW